MAPRQRWVERTPASRRRSYWLFASLYLAGAVLATVLGWDTLALGLAAFGLVLGLMGLWDPEPRRR